MISLSLALRNTWRQTARTAITVATIATGVAALTISGGFIVDTFTQLAEAVIHSQLGHIQVAKDGYFSRGARPASGFLIPQPEGVMKQAVAQPGVKDVLQRISFSGLLSNGRSDMAIFGEGVEPDKESELGSYMRIVEGRHLTDADHYGVLLGYGIARSLHLKPGDSVTVLVTTPDGALNSLDFEVTGVFQTISKDYDARALRVSLRAAQELLGTNGVNVLIVSLHDTSQTDDVALHLRGGLSEHYELRTWYQLSDFYSKTVDLYEAQFGALRIIVLLMVVLGVANSINMSIFERQAEFATMRALGSYTADVFRLILTEAFLLGILGAIVGISAGVGIALLLSSIGIPMPPPPNADVGYTARIELLPSTVLIASLIGLASTLLAALLPAFRVSRIPLADALRRGV